MTMFLFSRLFPKPKSKSFLHFGLLSHLSPKSKPYPYLNPLSPAQTHNSPKLVTWLLLTRSLSTNNNQYNNGNDQSTWKLSPEEENDGKLDSFFTLNEDDSPASWCLNEEAKHSGDDGRTSEEGYKQWSLEEGDDDEKDHQVFDIDATQTTGDSFSDSVSLESDGDRTHDHQQKMLLLTQEEKRLTDIITGPNRAFGDLIAASGITDAMLDNLIALKDFEGVEGLPPLSEIEDMRYEKSTRKSARAEIERQKQEEVAKARVRRVDEKGRAYGTGRRKCSVARVWIQPGDGQFLVNDKQFDIYFPMLDHRASLLRPFSETKTLGLWDVNCTVKGGGVSGQVGAIQLGISRALQNWEPDLRPALRSAGFLTRDPRVVERKKPGKAKARKSFQWVKR